MQDPKVYITDYVFYKINAYINNYEKNKELTGLFLGYPLNYDSIEGLLVNDTVLLKLGKIAKADVNLKEMDDAIELINKTQYFVVGFWHSHGGIDTFHSEDDFMAYNAFFRKLFMLHGYPNDYNKNVVTDDYKIFTVPSLGDTSRIFILSVVNSRHKKKFSLYFSKKGDEKFEKKYLRDVRPTMKKTGFYPNENEIKSEIENLRRGGSPISFIEGKITWGDIYEKRL